MAAVAVVNAATVAVQRLGYAAMKPEQLQVVSGIVSGRDVFAVFAHWLWEESVFCVPAFGFYLVLRIGEPSIILVVTPLTAIMKDQVNVFCTAKLAAVCAAKVRCSF